MIINLSVQKHEVCISVDGSRDGDDDGTFLVVPCERKTYLCVTSNPVP